MKATLFVSLILSFTTTWLQAQTYGIDSGHSSIQIEVTRFGLVDVVGRFDEVAGSITYASDQPEGLTAQATIQVESYDANNSGGEAAVKSAAFLDAAQYPEISFQSTMAAARNGSLILKGDLTLHGVTKTIEFPVEIIGPMLDLPTQKQSIAMKASTVINRQDFGVSFDRKLPTGTPLVANEVKITLRILAIEK